MQDPPVTPPHRMPAIVRRWLARPTIAGWSGVFVGLVVTAMALLVKAAIVPLAGANIGYLILFAGIPIAALVGGFTAGAVVVIAGALVDALIFHSPAQPLTFTDPAAAARFVLFIPIGLWLAWLVAAVGTARRTAALSAERFETVLAGFPDFAILVEPDGRTIEYGNRAVAMLDWTPEALVGRQVDEVIPDLGDLAPASTDQRPTHEILTPTGREIPVDLRSAAVTLPTGATRYLLTARDASERIDAEVRLLRLAAAERTHVRALEAVIGAMEDGVALVAPEGRITVANDALALMAGRPFETRAELEGLLDVELVDGETVVPSTARQLSLRTYAIHDGSSASTLLVARDVTEERRAAAAQDAFIGVLSHELRTPVTTIMGFAELMMRPGFDPVMRDSTGLLPDLAAEATRLGQLIDDLLVLSRAQGGQMTIEVEPVLVDRLIQDAVAEESARYPLVRFEIETTERLPPVDGDMTYLGQVLRNIIGNAGKYGPTPGVVRVRAFAADGWVTVAVLDDGPGFDAEEASKLFEIFFRSARTAGTQAGSGIGLYVARTLVEAMGGRIWARLRDEGGSEFGFSLPIIDVNDVDADRTMPSTPATQRG